MNEWSAESLLEKLSNLNIWQNGDRRAPHKPLLLLVALGRVSRQLPRMGEYSEFRGPLKRLLREFAPTQTIVHPEYPFYRLTNDGLWELAMPGPEGIRESLGENPSDYMLRQRQISGGFPADLQLALESDPDLLRSAVELLLQEYFPDTLHDDLISETAIDLDKELILRTRRDPSFRKRILRAYEFHCALCGFDLKINQVPVGLDAAHIRWKQAKGPDDERNGLALCTLHHRLFDRGAFTVTNDLRAIVSSHVAAGDKDPWLLVHHGKEVRRPQEHSMLPAEEHLAWHLREVFRAPSRG